jgi:hypothetical protein
MAVKIECMASLCTLRFAKMLVVHADQTSIRQDLYHVRMIPYLPFSIPYLVAVQISGQDDRRTVEPFRMGHQRQVDLPNVAVCSFIT